MRISEAMMIASAIETSDKKVWEAIVTLIEAVKKQEPMNAILNYVEYSCPKCELTISEYDEYCWHCGQKLDWEDEA